MEIIESLYHILYTKEKACTNSQNRLLKNITIKLTDEQMTELHKAIDEKERIKSLKSLPNGKSSCLNRLTKEFMESFFGRH